MKETRKRLLAILALLLSPMAANADLIGAEIGLRGLDPDTSTVFQDFGTAIVGAGVEFPAGGFSLHNIDLSATEILFDFMGDFGGSFSPSTFNGFQLYDAGGTLNDILSVSFSSGIGYTGANTPVVTWDANNIFVNFAGIAFQPGYEVTFSVATAVPEPSTLALFGLGLLGLGFARRRA